ncbi:MAG: PKD domain-containing protein [Muribaculaceae bacterium]|nr:PKD domain-containing protein [Muribaculaceae bacterium]MDY6412042.1 PKD domain-containing protein [Bacteroidales bacterium]
MKKITLFFIVMALVGMNAAAQALNASFGAQEAMVAYYEQGWDSQDQFNTWTYTATSSSTWKLGNLSKSFSTIDPSSSSSMILNYNSGQNEVATSPAIEILPGSQLEFYCYASGIYLVYGAWKLYAIVDGSSTLLIDQFLWAQDKGYDGPSWEKFTVDLSTYAGKQVQFSFVYQGDYGEDEAIDGFKVKQANTGDDAVINIKEGESVHFMDNSTGNITSWNWTFEGGNPSSSSEQNPVVTYDKAGSYTVSLTVGDGTTTSTVTREAYVNVEGEAPIAQVGLPQGAYLSPWVMMFVPTNVPLTFTDESTGNPSQWAWTFQGTDVLSSSEQNPTVTYLEPGNYGLKLEVTNDMGSNVFEVVNTAIQAGGEQEIWNIAPEENGDLSMIEMGWYGNYGGTNWLGMGEFAEHFDAPLADATISQVNVYFGKTTAASSDYDIEMKIMAAGADGMPGEVLGTTSLKASELAYDPTTVNATEFVFDNPVSIKAGTEFFAVVGPFPNDNGDDIAILLVRRGEGEKCTAYHFVYDEDENYNYLETGTWYKNVDDPISLAVAPKLKYNVNTAISTVSTNKQVTGVTYYNVAGVASVTPFDGINIVVTRYSDGSQTATKILR